MKKVIVGVVSIVLIVGGVFVYFHFFANNEITSDKAMDDEEGRYITVINNTGEIINEVHLYTNEGIEVKKCEMKNPDEKNYTLEVPQSYNKVKKFKLKFVDNYKAEYEKKFIMKKKGITPVKMTTKNCIKECSKFDKIVKFFNRKNRK